MTFLRVAVVLSAFFAFFSLSACSQCVTTECGDGRSATWCTKQGKACEACRNHKLTSETGQTLYGCEDASTTSTCDNIIKRDITDYCATGKVCTGLGGTCSVNSDCCSGICGSVSKQCIAR